MTERARTGPILSLEGVAKSFTMHLRGGLAIDVVHDVGFSVATGECVVLGGPSGVGKSSVLKMIYGNYRCDIGRILVRDGTDLVDVATAAPRRVQILRRTVMGYVSQFLRVIPRVGALDIVATDALESGLSPEAARARARELLSILNLPERLWELPPATFSGGEQQRVNIARGFAARRPLLLLDEPTASLDAANRAAVVSLIQETRRAGTAMVGIFHDHEVRDAVSTRVIDMSRFPGKQAA